MPMSAILDTNRTPTRSLWRSDNTKPLPHGTCNMPWNAPEEVREIIDELDISGANSRNAKFKEIFLDYLRRNKAEAYERACSAYGSAALLLILGSSIVLTALTGFGGDIIRRGHKPKPSGPAGIIRRTKEIES